MPAPRLAIRMLVVLAGIVAGTVGWAPAPAGAHTEVLRATPAPGAEVTGPVERVELVFLDPVDPSVTISVGRELGEPIAGLQPGQLSDDGRTASVTFPPVAAAGDYVVEYQFTALDGDSQRETYRFTVLGGGEEDGEGDAAGGAGALVGAAAAAAMLVAGAVASVRRRRSRTA